MTNTKFRKRALLSSVAMLVVALIALGSATFAWYQAKEDVDADGIHFTTTASAGLLIASQSEMGAEFNDAYDFDAAADLMHGQASTQSLQPSSYDQTNKKWFNITSTGPATAAHAAGTANAVSGATYVLSDIVYFKLDAGAADKTTVYLNGVTINKLSGDDYDALSAPQKAAVDAIAGGIRVVLRKNDASETFIGEYAITGGSESYYSGSGDTGTLNLYDAESAPTGGKTITTAGVVSNTAVSSVGATALATNGVKVYVYLDGEATGVFTNNAKVVADAFNVLDYVHLDFSLNP